MSEILGQVDQVGARHGQALAVSRYTGPEGAAHLQLTSPGDVVQLDQVGAAMLRQLLDGWLGDDVRQGIVGQGRVDLLDRIMRYVKRDGRHAGPYLADWLGVALRGDAVALRELDRRMREKRA